MKGILHQLLSADPRAVKDCLSFVKPGDELLLINAGVHLLNGPNSILAAHEQPGCEFRVFALETDVKARGLQSRAEQRALRLLDDQQWLEHVCGCQQVLSWR